MSLLLRPKSIVGTKGRWQNFTDKICENTSENLNYFAFNSVLLSFLGFGKLRAHVLYTEQWWAKCQVHLTWCNFLSLFRQAPLYMELTISTSLFRI